MSLVSSFDIISVILLLLCEVEDEGRWPDLKIFLGISAFAADYEN